MFKSSYKLSIRFLDIIYSLSNRILKNTVFKSKDLSFIAMFHDVNNKNETLRDSYACYENDLISFIEYYKKQGFSFLSMDEMFSGNSSDYLKKKCVITFDDGFESIYTIVTPLFNELKIPFTIYIVYDYIGKEGYLNKEQLKELSENPLCTIGSHSLSHPLFRFIKKREVYKELILSKEYLAKMLNKQIEHFAFPYGSFFACSKRDISRARKVGYKTIALTKQIPLHKGCIDKLYKLPRLNMPRLLREMEIKND